MEMHVRAAASEVPDVESGGFEEQRARAQIAKWLKEPLSMSGHHHSNPSRETLTHRKYALLVGNTGLSPASNDSHQMFSMNVLAEAPEGHATPRDVDF